MKSEVEISCAESRDSDEFKQGQSHPDVRPIVNAWPTEPKPLTQSTEERGLWAAYDGALIALPVLLMIKTGLCVYAYNRDKVYSGTSIDSASYMSSALVNLNSQLVTLFTIVFVTIISTFVKRFALWKAQKGAYVTDLEQLQGSVSLPSTLKLVWSLRSFGLQSVLLVLVWSFYYLGSQAVKMEYQLSPSDRPHQIKAAVQRSDAPSYFDSDPSTIYNLSGYTPEDPQFTFRNGSDIDRLNIYFQALQLEKTGGGGEGFSHLNPGFRNGPLVPDYRWVSDQPYDRTALAKPRREFGGWQDYSRRSQMLFISDTSTPIRLSERQMTDGVPYYRLGNDQRLLGSYTLYNISYLNITCGDLFVLPISAFPGQADNNTSISFNLTALSQDTSRDHYGYPLRTFTYSYRGKLADPLLGEIPETLPDILDTNSSQRTVQSTCSITRIYVDMEVSCLSTGCYPHRMRWANNTDKAGATGYSTPFDSDSFGSQFLDNFIRSTGHKNSRETYTLIDHFYTDPSLITSICWSTYGRAKDQTVMDYKDSSYNMNAALMSDGLTLGFNTYYILSQIIVTEKIYPNLNSLFLDDQKQEDKFFKFVNAEGAPYKQAYRIYWQWVPVDLVACSILLAAAIGSCWLRVNTLAPDIFGFVSSLTRDNPHLQLPSEGSSLNGIDRARMLKKVKVKLGNVQEVTAENGTVGTIGLAPVQADVKPLAPTNVYR